MLQHENKLEIIPVLKILILNVSFYRIKYCPYLDIYGKNHSAQNVQSNEVLTYRWPYGTCPV